MSLIAPILDDRTFQQLRDELVQRIRVYTAKWTDYNESDPGIALLQLFAFLGESLLFRFNQIPDATKAVFLSLLGVDREPAAPASVLVTVETEQAQGVQLVRGSTVRAGDTSFQTQGEVYAWPLAALGAVKTVVEGLPEPSAGASDAERARLRYETERRRDAARRLGVADQKKAVYYETTLVPTEPVEDDRSVIVRTSADAALWVALLGSAATLVELQGRSVFLGIAMDERLEGTSPGRGEPASPRQPIDSNLPDADDPPGTLDRQFGATGLDEAPPPTLWRLWRGTRQSTDGTAPAGARSPFRTLDTGADTTRGLTRTGVLRLDLPATIEPLPPPSPSPAVAGDAADGDGPPLLEDRKQAEKVVAWLQVTRPAAAPGSTADPIGAVRWVGLNATQAVQQATASAELLGTGTGDTDQRYRLVHQQVLPGTVALEVEELDGWHPWQEVADFTASGVDDRHFTVDREAGLVRFGRRSQVPQIGQRIRVREYAYGGGAAGNVAAGAVTSAPDVAGVTVHNPLPAAGGRDAESLPDALARIPDAVHRRDRAVTPRDFRDLAAQVTDVGRAETLPLFHPDAPAEDAAGVLSVMIFPADDARHPGAPRPDRALLRRVAAHLNPRRLITTELYVVPPDYVPIHVAAGVAVRDGYQVDGVRRWVELILRQFLAPLPPYGPDGGGWPLGRTVRRAELEAVAVQVEGVEYVEGLALARPVGEQPGDRVDTIELARWQVPELCGITVVRGRPLAPGEGYQPAAPPDPSTPVVPLPRQVC